MLLREIRYMKYLDKQGIPADGLELYARNEKLQVIFLEFSIIVSRYFKTMVKIQLISIIISNYPTIQLNFEIF